MKEGDPEKIIRMHRPEPVVFVLSTDKSGRPFGMIAAWIMRCSYNPPIIAVALSENGYTHNLIKESKEFVVAVPNKGMEEGILYFGSTHGNEVDKFRDTNIKTIKSKSIKTPLLADATLNFECKLIKEIKMGDHFIFFGEIAAAYHNKDKKIMLYMGRKEEKRWFEEF